MSNQVINNEEQTEQVIKNELPIETTGQQDELTLEYILGQIARIQSDTGYLVETLQMLSKMPPSAPGDIQGQAKAQALGDIVRYREETNQSLLKFYKELIPDCRAAELKREKRAKETLTSVGECFDALKLAIEKQAISTSMLQLHFSIGYTQAKQLIEEMERKGFISAFDPEVKTHRVLITYADLSAMKKAETDRA